jgi:hypothetical protein
LSAAKDGAADSVDSSTIATATVLNRIILVIKSLLFCFYFYFYFCFSEMLTLPRQAPDSRPSQGIVRFS